MDLNITKGNITAFAKILFTAIVTLGGLWVNPASHDALVKLIMTYPHGSQVVGLITTFFVCWGILHDPAKKGGQ